MKFNIKNDDFSRLCRKVQKCRKCTRMENSERVLNMSVGNLDSKIFFLGEAPGRLGADCSKVPFHGDTAGNNFEALLKFSGLNRYDIYVTNTILCNPKTTDGNNGTPNREEILNCNSYLKEQLNIVKPDIIVTLGGTALSALSEIEKHNLKLSRDVRTIHNWYGRKLIPLFHPGQRAMIHRSFANQRSDYQFVVEQYRRLSKKQKPIACNANADVMAIASYLIQKSKCISYFSLHKLFYLAEYRSHKLTGKRLTNGYIIRQKDGPYCTDLHYKKLKANLPHILVTTKNKKLFFEKKNTQDLLFMQSKIQIDEKTINILNTVLSKYGNANNSSLKSSVYLTKPMRAILRREEKERINLYNSPISFSDE